MRSVLFAAVFAMLAGCAFAAESATPGAVTADQIMAKVAANQDRTEAARTRYIYLQHIRAVSRKPGGKVMCEEITDSRVSPRAKGSQQELLKLDGRYLAEGSLHPLHDIAGAGSAEVRTRQTRKRRSRKIWMGWTSIWSRT